MLSAKQTFCLWRKDPDSSLSYTCKILPFGFGFCVAKRYSFPFSSSNTASTSGASYIVPHKMQLPFWASYSYVRNLPDAEFSGQISILPFRLTIVGKLKCVSNSSRVSLRSNV